MEKNIFLYGNLEARVCFFIINNNFSIFRVFFVWGDWVWDNSKEIIKLAICGIWKSIAQYRVLQSFGFWGDVQWSLNVFNFFSAAKGFWLCFIDLIAWTCL